MGWMLQVMITAVQVDLRRAGCLAMVQLARRQRRHSSPRCSEVVAQPVRRIRCALGAVGVCPAGACGLVEAIICASVALPRALSGPGISASPPRASGGLLWAAMGTGAQACNGRAHARPPRCTVLRCVAITATRGGQWGISLRLAG